MRILSRIPSFTVAIIGALLAVSACATTEQPSRQKEKAPGAKNESANQQNELLTSLNRPVPYSISDEVPQDFLTAITNNTRTISGAPGTDYWQQESDYQIDVEVLPQQKKVTGNASITYHNNSPDTLRQIFFELSQNLHKEGAPRKAPAEITGGIEMERFSYEGSELQPVERRGQNGYLINGTIMVVLPEQSLLPGQSVSMQAEWSFTIPESGADGRMGFDSDNLIYIAYWYPKVRVYDDVNGWFTDAFLGNAEFYNEFGDFDVTVTAPPQWIVAATGTFTNAQDVLRPPVYERLMKAYGSDSVMNVVGKNDFGNITRQQDDSTVSWKFSAENVNDFAFSLTKESIWDATRTPVGDLNNDGATDYAHINALYRSSAPLWKQEARYAQHSIKFLSEFTGLPYPWPQMTSVEGGGIIGGGMEFPMMTLMGDYRGRQPESLYAVTAHELAHMWVPMQVATNERRYAWMDEGATTFNENQAKKDFYPNSSSQPDISDFRSYTQITNTDLEGPIMRRSDFQYTGTAYGVASYPKPASVLAALRGLLGNETFTKAYRTFMERWRFKHPYPWDMFNTFEDVSGRDLDWFWRSWYYETWELDQAVTEVEETETGARITIQDFGEVPMPAEVSITLANGQTLNRTIDVETWLRGATSTILTIDAQSDVTSVQIDPDHLYPDADRSNNTWTR